MVEIEISNNQEEIEIGLELIQSLTAWATQVCEMLGIEDKTISVVIIDKAGIKELNQHYRHKDQPTDVLSFPLSAPDSPEPILGEIIIAAAVAAEQAQTYNNDLQREMSFLLLHGLLHLAGYDHDEEHRGPMRDKEKELFERLELEQLQPKSGTA